MTHFYPQGAIQTVEEANRYVGHTLYAIRGLGSSSWMEEELPTGYAYSSTSNSHIMPDKGMGIFLGDRNIGCHHNQHYLFHNKPDAEAYLAYAKTQTREIERDWWDTWDDYDDYNIWDRWDG